MSLQRAKRCLQVLHQNLDVVDAVEVERGQDAVDVASLHEAMVSAHQRRLDGVAQGPHNDEEMNAPGRAEKFALSWVSRNYTHVTSITSTTEGYIALGTWRSPEAHQ